MNRPRALVLLGICLLKLAHARSVDADPQVSYTALSDAARRAGQLDRYQNVPQNAGTLKLGDYVLSYSIPKQVRAYDVVPIGYHLGQPAGARRVAVEAVAGEDPAKVQGRALYDAAIPGELKVNIEYLGSVSADYDTARCVFLTPDPKTPVSPYPALSRSAGAIGDDPGRRRDLVQVQGYQYGQHDSKP